MPLLSAFFVALLPFKAVEALGDGDGHFGISRPNTGSIEAVDHGSQNPWNIAVDGRGEDNEDLDEQTSRKTASTIQHLGTADSADALTSPLMSSFAIQDESENDRDSQYGYLGRKEPVQDRHQHRVSLRNMDNVQYFGDMMVGEPPQRMKILFDTGSSDTWVSGIGCKRGGSHSGFDDIASSTAVSMGRKFSNRYESGSVEGSVIRDRVLVDGMAVKGVEMGLVRHQEDKIRGFKADGIVGLAFPSISTTQHTSPSKHSTFLQLLQEQYGVIGDLFSVYLTPFPNQPGSTLIFGGYDLDLVRRPKRKPRKKPSSSLFRENLETEGVFLDGSIKRRLVVREERRWVPRRRKGKGGQLRGGATVDHHYHHHDEQQQADGRRLFTDGVRDSSEEVWASEDGKIASDSVREGVSGFYATSGANVVKNGDVLSSKHSAVELESMLEGIDGSSSEGYRDDQYGPRGNDLGVLRKEAIRGRQGGEGMNGVTSDGNDGDDEPVIVWAPVVEYRNSLSYWTVQLTGWRTETSPSAISDGYDNHNTVTTSQAPAPSAPPPRIDGDRDFGGGHDEPDEGSAKKHSADREMCPTGCQAIIDTGSSLLVPPRSQYQAVMDQITRGRKECYERRGMVFCSRCDPGKFPDIVITVAAVSENLSGNLSDEKLPPSSMRSGRDDTSEGSASARRDGHAEYDGGGRKGKGARFYQEFRLRPSDYLSQSWNGCEILIGEGRATDIWTLGDVFIKTYMTIFDVANLRVGFVCADGGRCTGGASYEWRQPIRACWPFSSSSKINVIRSAEAFDEHCLYLRYNAAGLALMAVSALLFVMGCVLCVRERSNDSSSSSGSTASSPFVSPPSGQVSSSFNPLPSFLFDGQQKKEQQLQESPRSVVSQGSGDPKSGKGIGNGGESTPATKSSTSERQRGSHRKGGPKRSLLRWTTRGSKNFLPSFAGKSAPTGEWIDSARRPCQPTRAPSSGNVSTTPEPVATGHQHTRRYLLSQDGLGSGGSSGSGTVGGAGSVGALSSNGMRSRGGSLRLACAPFASGQPSSMMGNTNVGKRITLVPPTPKETPKG